MPGEAAPREELPAPADALTEPWWAATRSHRLLLQHCATCGRTQWYPRPMCLSCRSPDGLHWVPATGRATVDTFTVVHRAPHPLVATPYVIARVRLAEGVLMLTRIVDTDNAALACGLDVTLTWQDLPDGRALPVFRSPVPARRP